MSAFGGVHQKRHQSEKVFTWFDASVAARCLVLFCMSTIAVETICNVDQVYCAIYTSDICVVE